MKVTAIRGREDDFPDCARDELLLESDDLARRVFRKKTASGREVKVSLPRNTILRPGDVLLVEDGCIVVVRVVPEWVLVVRPTTFEQIAEAGHQLGNRHIPIQIYDDEIIVAYHPLLETLFQGLEIPCERVLRTLDQPFLHIFAPHMH
ncbi:urease accessory protein UreE [Alicyclobacillus fastidiosus]|uniref:Urease accessory protein UreE n=1 Tax=Alicyclobacillus fastidiosus TaxID=392011 RepID=A0ABY6ZFA6_9BACL|nr:urease accessory protein UreE [Alicyclobacillus fastidiosus]WAH41182.1 urease accessory protein UreE [Alicyclobacillus fastidiosus]GMA62758.1 urease accessory protein UreE [Alicyclobacillus fastidiosus]